MQNRFKIMLALWAMAFSAIAAEVDLDTAKAFAKNWRGKGVRTARTHKTAAGESRFHVVNFEGGGWAAVGTDDEESPVIAFADNGEELVEDEKNPVWYLVKRDAEWRAKGREISHKEHKGHRGKHRGWERKRRGEGVGEGEGVGRGVKTATVKTSVGDSALEDVRVAPLIQSTWDQKTAGGYKTYNYYTPGNYYCGCVATMMAQIMRYYEWPKTSVAAKTYECMWGSNISMSSTMTTGDKTMFGGVYDWSKMPLNPNSSTSDANRQEIGKLCYDCGVSVHMMWSSVGSGTFTSLVREALVDTFGYSNAHLVVYDYPTEQYPQVFHAYDFDELKTIVISNCEAGLPIGYGISGDGGHAVVIDGYGYSSDGEFYMHINPGWSGSSNTWYNPPNLAMGGYAFDESDELVYNIFPEGTGALVTGRVKGPDDEPVEGATVSGFIEYRENVGRYSPSYVTRTNIFTSVVTDARGKYHIKTGVVGSRIDNEKIHATATKGRLFGTATTDLPRSQTMLGSRTNPFNGGYSTNSYSLGNKIDFNIQLENQKIPPRVIFR